ncbi:MAG: TIGR01777 family oxidoreductase [Deltaproteobacteria bacterium]|nr:TIGR01777 family oxidoreductase [Deltaproteobacteria bacterium]
MKVLVTGGTGFIGRALVKSLVERKDEVLVLSRGAPKKEGQVEHATWTPEERGDWMKLVESVDAIVHLAGAGVLDERWTPARKEVLRSSRIVSTSLLAEAIANAPRKPRVFVSGSAVGYYGIRAGDRVLDESSPAGDDFLARLVVEWEAAAAPSRDVGVRTCMPRIGLVVGRGGGFLERMLPAFKAFCGGPIGDGFQYLAWIHVVDTVRALEHALDDASKLDGPFNVTAPEPITMNAFSRALGKALGRPSLFRVPSAMVKLAIGEGSEAVLTGQRAVPRRLVEGGFDFVFPDVESALADVLA